MSRTFARLAVYMEKEHVNKFIPGRKSNCVIENKKTEGMGIMFGLNSDIDYLELQVDLPDDVDLEVAEEDLEVDIVDEFE